MKDQSTVSDRVTTNGRRWRTLTTVASSDLFVFHDPSYRARTISLLRRVPALCGRSIDIQGPDGLGRRRGPVHAGSFLRERRIAFDCTHAEFARIFVHELAHFIWLRLGNAVRYSFEELVSAELAQGARGELGWSAERRKKALKSEHRQTRSRAWREYCCESFCDTAAWLWSGRARHSEFTLALRHRKLRARWFANTLGEGPLSI